MPVDPRVATVVKTVNQIVADAGGKIITLEHVITIVAACAISDECRKAMTGLIYGAVELAHKVERELFESDELQKQMRATLEQGVRR